MVYRSIAVQFKKAEWINNTPQACSLRQCPKAEVKEAILACDWMLDSAGRPDRQLLGGPHRHFKVLRGQDCESNLSLAVIFRLVEQLISVQAFSGIRQDK